MDQVFGVVRGRGPWSGPWAPVHVLYSLLRPGWVVQSLIRLFHNKREFKLSFLTQH